MLVWTNGCFDLLGPHHIDFLQRARRCGDRLFVGLNTDESVTRLKGEGRPIYSHRERKAMLLALRCVDFVCRIDSEEELEQKIRMLMPDVLVKGQDYSGKVITGSQWARKVVLLPMMPNHSTSQTIEKIVTQSLPGCLS